VIRRINRFELKYVIDAFQARAFLADLAPFVRADPYADATGCYRVVSLYYDSPQYHFYRAKIEGLKFRRKLRLRIYPPRDGGAVSTGMVEIKQRINQTVQKRRIALDLEAGKVLCAGDSAPADLDPTDEATASEVRAMVTGMQLGPVCVISYLRRPFVGGAYDPGLRITLDTGLSARVHALEVNLEALNHHFLRPDLCVLEVKVNERVPKWLASLLASHDFSVRRVSKYCEGLRRATHLTYCEAAESLVPML
jgi:SPX domain protein involved in polyphosphate accumulation